ncbi:MAG: death on curing protein [Ilumatobacteraceae bacterium]
MTRYLDLAEFFWLAEQVTGLDTTILVKASPVELADSALHAPQAGYGDEDFYLDIYDKAAVLTCRIAWNHPLPDGNKRAAWACLLLFVDLNGGSWDPDPPDVEDAVERCSMSRRARLTRSRSPVGSASGFDSLSSLPGCQS